jgi:Sulfotransferase family
MIGADKFVFVHLPKTGGTFVTETLISMEKLLGSKWIEKKHANCRAIPAFFRDKIILSIIRNPYDRYVSQYEFGWWKREQFLPYYREVPDFNEKYPDFPELEFSDFVRLYNEAFCTGTNRDLGSENGLGYHTERFVNFYFKVEKKAGLLSLKNMPVTRDNSLGQMFPVRFIHQERLNTELYEFLLELGYPDDTLRTILDRPKVYPHGGQPRNLVQQWSSYYEPELLDFVRRRERILFELFPEYNS